jgi:hypothetical protein
MYYFLVSVDFLPICFEKTYIKAVVFMTVSCEPRLVLLLVLDDDVSQYREAVELVSDGEGIDFPFFCIVWNWFTRW